MLLACMQGFIGVVGVDYQPAFHINKEFALELGWFVKSVKDTYGLGPNLIMEPMNDSMPPPKDVDSSDQFIGKSLTMTNSSD